MPTGFFVQSFPPLSAPSTAMLSIVTPMTSFTRMPAAMGFPLIRLVELSSIGEGLTVASPRPLSVSGLSTTGCSLYGPVPGHTTIVSPLVAAAMAAWMVRYGVMVAASQSAGVALPSLSTTSVAARAGLAIRARPRAAYTRCFLTIASMGSGTGYGPVQGRGGGRTAQSR